MSHTGGSNSYRFYKLLTEHGPSKRPLLFVCLYRGLTLISTISQSCRNIATTSLALTTTPGSKCVLLKDTSHASKWELNPAPLDLFSGALPPGPKVIKLFSCSTQLSMKFKLLTITEIAKISCNSGFTPFRQ